MQKPSFTQRFLSLLWQEKKWWAIPILIFVAVLIAIILFTRGPDPLSPFMYQTK